MSGMRWRLILQKELSSSYALALDDALHRVVGKEGSGTLHLYSTVPALLLGRWQRTAEGAFEGVDKNRRLTGGGAVLSDEKFLLFSMAFPSSFCGECYELLGEFQKALGRLFKGRMGADGLIRRSKKVVGFLSVGSECANSFLLQGGFDVRVIRARSLAVAQRLLKERLEEHFGLRFGIDTLTTDERNWLQHLLRKRYLLDEWRNLSDRPPEFSASLRRLHADFYVRATVSRSVVEDVLVWGSFIGDAERLRKELRGVRATKRALSGVLKKIPSSSLPYGFRAEELLTVMHTAVRKG